MKHQVLRLAIFLSMIPAITYGQEKRTIVGEWADINNSNLKMSFYADSSMDMMIEGKNSRSLGLTISYTIDYSKNPVWVDVTGRKPTGQTLNMNGLIRFVNDSTINVFLNSPGAARPAGFEHVDQRKIGTLIRSRYHPAALTRKGNSYIVTGTRNGKSFTDTVEIDDPVVLNELKRVEREGKNYKPTRETPKEEFDSKGNLKKKYATSLEKSLYQLSYTKYTYDNLNRKIRIENFNSSDKPVNVDYDISVTQFVYDEYGNQIEEKYYDKDLKPAVFDLGPHIIRSVYDQHNRLIETTYFDKHQEPLQGYAKIKFVYDHAGKLVERIFFDEKGKETQRKKE